MDDFDSKPAPSASRRRATDYRPLAAAREDVDRRVRGPRHRRPVLLRWTAVLHIFTRILFIAAFVCAPLCLLQVGHPQVALVILVAALFLTWTTWLVAASKVGCRICAMRMFYNKSCVKNRKAPNWPLLGPHTTMAVLALFSTSIRCPYCGTPNELTQRERDDD
jgi:hypothetical protein